MLSLAALLILATVVVIAQHIAMRRRDRAYEIGRAVEPFLVLHETERGRFVVEFDRKTAKNGIILASDGPCHLSTAVSDLFERLFRDYDSRYDAFVNAEKRRQAGSAELRDTELACGSLRKLNEQLDRRLAALQRRHTDVMRRVIEMVQLEEGRVVDASGHVVQADDAGILTIEEC